MAHFLNKDISAHGFRDVVQSVIHEVIYEQVQFGLDEITDGLISWQDPISHFCAKMAGFKITGLRRYFDTNFYYRLPQITSKPKRREPLLLDEFLYAQGVAGKPLRVVLTGPVTLATHSEGLIKPYDKFSARFDFFKEILADEISTLSSKGASLIQIDEPALLQHPEYFEPLKKALDTFSQKAKPSRLILAVFFSSAFPLIDKLLTLPVDSLNLDLTIDGKKTFDKLLESKTKLAIGFGLFSSRNTRMEAMDPIINQMTQWIEKSEAESCYLTPSSGLEFLPREHVGAKLKLLGRIKQEIQKNLPQSVSL